MRSRLFALLGLAALATTSWSRAADGDVTAAAHAIPAWLRDGVIYEVFPRAFSPQGNFQGVIPQLDRLKTLGVNVLWFMPIHPMGKLKAKGTLGSPYAVRDYDAINPDYGTPEDFKRLIAAAHQRGMKVFIDIVANHTSWDAVLLRTHPDWYTHDAVGQIIPPNPDWVDVADLDYSKPALRKYMSEMLVRWLRDYDLDGFRCDYASGVPTDFWDSVRPQLERAHPGVILLAEADKGLGDAFDVRPKLGVEVKPVPEFAQATAPGAYYQPGSFDGSRPGVFYANMRNTAETPKFAMATLAYHEGIPGHHFQIAIAQELAHLPFFRRILPFTAYSEGWALYAERLAWELGFEKDPLDNLGRLRDEMMRAVRLVVDTGIHAERWTREQAITYMTDNTGMYETDVVAEIERYFVDPGQALAYKIGELKLKELRALATKELGDKFDVREFHDQVLDNGAVPLDILEQRMREWLAARKLVKAAEP